MPKQIILLVLFVIIGYNVNGQQTYYSLIFDEDINPLVIGKTKDQNYTLGLGLTYGHESLSGSFIMKPCNTLISTIIKDDNLEIKSIPCIYFIGTGFTPDNLQAKEIVYGDRPYSFLIALGTSIGGYNETMTKFSEVAFNFGFLGLNTGGKLQSFIHSTMNNHDTKDPHDPKGWDHQISNGGEPTALLAISQSKLAPFILNKQRAFFDISYGYQLMIGYYNMAGVKLSARIGLLDPDNWTFRTQATSTGNRFLKAKGRKYPIQKTELYLFGSISPQIMVYNSLLQGQFKQTDYRLSSNEVNHFILEWSTGLGFSRNTRKNVTWNFIWQLNTGRTSELNTIYKRSHYWGSIAISKQINN